MDEIVELSVGAMHLMAKDVSSRLKMKQLNCIPVFVQVCITSLCMWDSIAPKSRLLDNRSHWV